MSGRIPAGRQQLTTRYAIWLTIRTYEYFSNSSQTTLGYILLRRLGMPGLAIMSLGLTWAGMEHIIRKAFGRSTQTYKSTKRVPLFGAGQGSTAGPFFWMLMFWVMAAAFGRALQGMIFMYIWAILIAQHKGDAFVDDSQFGVTSSYKDDNTLTMNDNIRLHELQVIEDLQKLAQQYERLLYTTGGALNLKKCHWVLISWMWNNGTPTLATIEQAPGELLLTDGISQVLSAIPRLQPTASYRTLGAYINGSGKMIKALQLSRSHSEDFAAKLRNSTISSIATHMAYNMYFMPKIGYALSISTFSEKECTFIQAPALSIVLPKMKNNRNTARCIVHGPARLGGLMLRNVYCEQGLGQLKLFLDHIRNKDHVGDTIIVAMSTLQPRIGSTVPFLSLPFMRYAKWEVPTWLSSLWQFFHTLGWTIDVRRHWTPQGQCVGDAALMSIFIKSGYKASELRKINQCRIYHQVFFISDRATADGLKIDDMYRQKINIPTG